MPKLNEEQVQAVLSALDGWRLVPPSEETPGGALAKTFQFRDFASAMLWINRVAEDAEEVAHHPDIHVAYNRVTLSLWTHDDAGITEKDAMMAEHIDDLPRQRADD